MKTKLSTLILSKLTFSSLKLTFTLLMLAFTTLTLTFTACSNDDEDNFLSEDEGKQLAHPAVVDFSAGITTRVTTSSEWEAGDLVGISASEIAGTVSTPKYTNIQYKADIAGASTAFSLVETEQEEIAYTSENDMIFTAYYPYTDNKDGVIEANTATTEEEQKKIDFLFASSKGKYIEGNANQKINFTFQHKMARIRLKIKVTDATPIENKSIILGGLIHKGTFNIKSGIASANGNVENDWSLGNLSSTASGTEMEIVRIIYPQNAESLDLRIGNEDDNLKTSFTLFGNKFEPNNSYTINAEVRNGKIHATITLDNNTIEGWNENEPGKKAFIGIADNMEELTEEAKAAATWMIHNIENSEYISINQITENNINLDRYKMIWAHFDWTEANTNNDAIVDNANEAIKSYFQTGGNILASRDAARFIGKWGISQNGSYPKNNWGGNENVDFNKSLYCNNIYHPIFNNITFNEHWLPLHAEDAGYKNSNRVLQWNINDETEKYDDINAWQTATGGIQLGSDGGNSDTTIRVAEFPSRENSGKAIVIGDPSFEWKNSNEESNSIHNNLTKLATNTISYLIGQSNNK